MSTFIVIAVLLAIAFAAWVGVRRFQALPKKKKKKLFTKSVNKVFIWFENMGLMRRTKAYDRDYLRQYPALAKLEAGHADVKEEVLKLLGIKDRLTDIKDIGAGYTEGGIHKAQWKAFMFKSGGRYVEDNCAMAPKTAALIKAIPDADTAFFSVLEPHQYITPHWGYYKGYMRYHLGVIIPENNANGRCWLRVHDDLDDNALKEKELIERGEKYNWHEGEGIVFDDNYLHDAANESDEVRVVLWLDMRRKMPFYAALFNWMVLWVVGRDESVEKIRRKAVVTT
ncbi:MAG TPA: aspartyl/asparaginyl beta-hydroxylase domain-containing protein [Pseudomonadales bacterium]|nr:aspartyl/asparaginyl beta-hydroxylase domain-containing protein [Pseudomonadales bacterium]